MSEAKTNPKYLVSACLIGKKCRYDGQDQAREFLVELDQKNLVIAVCPEEMGGLPTPRPPAEIIGDQVLTKLHHDVTAAYKMGAAQALDVLKANPTVEKVYLKSKSPMCGCGKIYDGQFQGQLKDGDGLFTQLIKTKCHLEIESVD